MNPRRFTSEDLLKIGARLSADRPLDGLELSKPRVYRNDESRMQVALVAWFSVVCKGYGLPEFALKSSPMSGVRDSKTGARLKREGARAGDPDLNLQVARGKYHGLYLELKTATGRVSPDQATFLAYLNSAGYLALICRSLDDAVKTIVSYLGDVPHTDQAE